jgi:hypothetical protein
LARRISSIRPPRICSMPRDSLFGSTNIQILPDQLLHSRSASAVAAYANIYDATRVERTPGPGNPDLPTVLRPVFGRQGNTNFHYGFV